MRQAWHLAEQTSVEDVTRKLGIANATFYRWKAGYGGLLTAEVKRLKQLEEQGHLIKNHITFKS